jgi:hypothetical protein
MARADTLDDYGSDARAREVSRARNPSYHAYQLLHWAFALVPVVAGLDKFFHFLVDWNRYLAPQIAAHSPLGVNGTMMAVGVVEVLAGVGVALRPRIFSYVVALWLAGIIANLILAGAYYDVALRDLGLCAGALALGRLAAIFDRRHRDTGRAEDTGSFVVELPRHRT